MTLRADSDASNAALSSQAGGSSVPGSQSVEIVTAGHAHETLPPLNRDSSFWGMAATQFLGAFNDNLFKQLVLLLATPTAA
jgi:acyl-[acyl-carrier-protein]-phospholipid O-acyltransferase/long-chain-fatty-acid--[acyl-carrier-protein] ligase